jgi:transcriptional regulator with GAF, ATPase, and Fis domain
VVTETHQLTSDAGKLASLADDAYVTTLEELARLLIEEASLTDLLSQVLELTSRAITASSAVSVTVVDDDGRYRTAAASTDEARWVDDAQYELGEGPCVEALETGEEHLLCDLTELERWARFRERALDLGFGCALAVPLRAGDQIVGALNVFAAEPDGLVEEDRAIARRIAAPAAATLANARAYRRVSRLAEQLQEALESRAVIEQAKGVLMAHSRTDPDAAFDRLRRTSQQRNLPLREVASEVIARAVGQVTAG